MRVPLDQTAALSPVIPGNIAPGEYHSFAAYAPCAFGLAISCYLQLITKLSGADTYLIINSRINPHRAAGEGRYEVKESRIKVLMQQVMYKVPHDSTSRACH